MKIKHDTGVWVGYAIVMKNTATDPVQNLATLIACRSITPDEGGALSALDAMLSPLGFVCERVTFSDDDTPDVENLYARRSGNGRHLVFAGHTDVVPVGDESAWTHDPFGAVIENGVMYGRGAVDMKGGIACFVAASARVIARQPNLAGSISMLITGDEEGPAINGSKKLLEWAAAKGEKFDACVLGEPTNPDALGDAIKIGRRGSLSGTITVQGKQGHAAYPHLADNPVRGITALLDALFYPVLDSGTVNFQPSNLEVTSVDVGNSATNVIAANASASFNIRFNDLWNEDSLRAEIMGRLEKAAGDMRLRPNNIEPVAYRVAWKGPVSQVFLTKDDALIHSMSAAVEKITGRAPALSTGGGTSDARFIKDYCPVVEFGLVGKTMHQVDERVDLDDLETLTQIYERFIETWFADPS